ncbi:MAG: hypothetical protein ACRC6A_08525 [Fusobacteriaceae bacterium]
MELSKYIFYVIAIVNFYTKIGKHCIINTESIVEHDNILSDYVRISPNATLCGGVKIGEETLIGVGAVVIENIEKKNITIVGMPAK